MTDFIDIYNNHAEEYDFLVKHEDYQDNLWKKLEQIVTFKDKRVAELGAGTGRLTTRLVQLAEYVHVFDRSEHMLTKAKNNLLEFDKNNYSLKIGENNKIPLEDQSVDIVIEGWSFGHSITDFCDDFENVTNQLINESIRVLKKDGVLIIIETLGTCKEEPVAPDEKLAYFYKYLENKLNFSHAWVRTDYKFNSIGDAKKSFGFFFGDDLVNYIDNNQGTIIPECTGIWWLKKS